MDAAEEVGDKNRVKALTRVGRYHGFIDPPRDEGINAQIRAAVRRRTVDLFPRPINDLDEGTS
jgi:hypothetical protein